MAQGTEQVHDKHRLPLTLVLVAACLVAQWGRRRTEQLIDGRNLTLGPPQREGEKAGEDDTEGELERKHPEEARKEGPAPEGGSRRLHSAPRTSTPAQTAVPAAGDTQTLF